MNDFLKNKFVIFCFVLVILFSFAKGASAQSEPVLYDGWNLIAGVHAPPSIFYANASCDVSIIWEWKSDTQSWRIWTHNLNPINFIDPASVIIDWMYPDRAYWVYCNGS